MESHLGGSMHGRMHGRGRQATVGYGGGGQAASRPARKIASAAQKYCP